MAPKVAAVMKKVLVMDSLVKTRKIEANVRPLIMEYPKNTKEAVKDDILWMAPAKEATQINCTIINNQKTTWLPKMKSITTGLDAVQMETNPVVTSAANIQA